MVRHNNIVPNQHFHKKWQTRVRTWLGQGVQKKVRRDKRKVKAAAIAPRPAAGALRPLVRAQTQRYNTKVRLGRGFTLEELKGANINPKFAATVGICVDHRRTNKCTESYDLNVARLNDYKSRLVVFPRKSRKVVKGDATKAETSQVSQLKGDICPIEKTDDEIEYFQLTEEMKAFNAHSALRNARNESKMAGIRKKVAEEKRKEDDEN